MFLSAILSTSSKHPIISLIVNKPKMGRNVSALECIIFKSGEESYVKMAVSIVKSDKTNLFWSNLYANSGIKLI